MTNVPQFLATEDGEFNGPSYDATNTETAYLSFDEPRWKQIEHCIKRLMTNLGTPDSRSLYLAMMQLLDDVSYIDKHAPPRSDAGLREALRCGLDAVMESYGHIVTSDDKLMADARHASLTEAITALSASQADEWRDISTAPKKPGAFDREILRLWDGKRERHGYWDNNAFHKKPNPYWHYSDSLSVSDDRNSQPTHWKPLDAPPVKQGAG